MEKQLKDRLLKAMKERDIKIPALSLATGIPQDRIYKWFSQDTNPKAQDTEKLNDWINGKIVLEQTPQYVTFTNEQYIESLQAQIKLLDAHNVLLQKMIETNLNEIRSNQAGVIVMLKELMKRQAFYKFGEDEKKMVRELAEINKIVGGVLK